MKTQVSNFLLKILLFFQAPGKCPEPRQLSKIKAIGLYTEGLTAF